MVTEVQEWDLEGVKSPVPVSHVLVTTTTLLTTGSMPWCDACPGPVEYSRSALTRVRIVSLSLSGFSWCFVYDGKLTPNLSWLAHHEGREGTGYAQSVRVGMKEYQVTLMWPSRTLYTRNVFQVTERYSQGKGSQQPLPTEDLKCNWKPFFPQKHACFFETTMRGPSHHLSVYSVKHHLLHSNTNPQTKQTPEVPEAILFLTLVSAEPICITCNTQ